ncbi:unnamed protein product [Pylaiella littoralis]
MGFARPTCSDGGSGYLVRAELFNLGGACPPDLWDGGSGGSGRADMCPLSRCFIIFSSLGGVACPPDLSSTCGFDFPLSSSLAIYCSLRWTHRVNIEHVVIGSKPAEQQKIFQPSSGASKVCKASAVVVARRG